MKLHGFYKYILLVTLVEKKRLTPKLTHLDNDYENQN